MNKKVINIGGWTLSILTFLLMAASALDKIRASQHAITMGSSFGISTETYRILGIVELTSAILFLIPRTSVVGFLLLASYMGGAIATHLQHGESIAFPVAIAVLIWVVAAIRLPELRARLWNVHKEITSPDEPIVQHP